MAPVGQSSLCHEFLQERMGLGLDCGEPSHGDGAPRLEALEIVNDSDKSLVSTPFQVSESGGSPIPQQSYRIGPLGPDTANTAPLLFIRVIALNPACECLSIDDGDHCDALFPIQRRNEFVVIDPLKMQ
jgi:hypothetical protein